MRFFNSSSAWHIHKVMTEAVTEAYILPVSKLNAKITSLFQKYSSSRALVGAFWVVAGSGGAQMIRLASNLILTRLLFPEVFGMVALTFAVIIGLGQISDVGLREGVVNSDRTSDPTFMRTAWTLQIIRTAVIALCAVILAVPFSHMYNEALLAPVLMMMGFAMFITGFKSISLLAYDKRLDLKTQIIADMCAQVLSLILTITWAYISPSIWALVAGQIFNSVLEVVFSYVLFKGHHSKLGWDKGAFKELFTFGKWIVVSSTISYIIVQGDRLIMGAWLTMGELGLYSIASNWAAIVALVSVNLSTRVLHPFFRSSLGEHSDFSKIHKTRVRLNAIYTLVCVVLAFFGGFLITFLYDERYHEAVWMLQVLAVGQIGRVFTGTLRPVLTACGDSFSQMITSAASAALLVIFIVVGGFLGQAAGVIIAYSICGIAMHPIMIYFAHKHGYHCAKADMGLALGATLVCLSGWWLFDFPVMEILRGISLQF